MTREERKRQRTSRLIAGAFFLVLILGAIVWLVNRYIPSKAHMDPSAFFKVSEGESAIIVDGKLFEEKGAYAGGGYFLDCAVVGKAVNPSVFYEDTEDLLIVTTPTKKHTYQPSDDPTQRTEACRIGGKTYISSAYLQEASEASFSNYADPYRTVVSTQDSYLVMSFLKDAPIRYRAGIKSPIIKDCEAGSTVRVIDVREDGEPAEDKVKKWTHVFTEDGFTGYVEDRFLGNLVKEETGKKNASPVYTRCFLGETVNLVFHQTTDEASNRALEEALSGVSGPNVIGPTWFFLESTDGEVRSLASRSYVDTAHSKGLKVWALVNDFDGNLHSASETGAALSSDSSRSRIVRSVMEGADQSGVDGICLDIELVRADSTSDYLELVREFSIECRNRGITLSICSYVPTFTAYLNRSEQARVADYLIVMCYDEHTVGSKEAGSVSSLPFVKKGIAGTIRESDAEQVIAALPFYTRLWTTSKDGEVSSVSCGMTRAEAYVKELQMETAWDDTCAQNYAEKKEEDGAISQIWLEDEASLKEKLKVVRESGCAGAAFWKLGLESSGVWGLFAA